MFLNGAAVSHFPTSADKKSSSEGLNNTSSGLEKSAVDEFKEFVKMTPAEKMRAMILGNLGITEDDLRNMSPEEREKIEAKIKEEVKKMVESQNEKKGIFVDIPA